MVFVAAELARKRQARGVKLNYPEAVAIISAEILEAARDGKSVADVMVLGTKILRREGWLAIIGMGGVGLMTLSIATGTGFGRIAV